MPSVQQTKNKLEQVKSAEEALLYTIKNITKEDIAALTTDFFLEKPDIVAISWTQYTPYFNDGEPCVFRAYLNDITATLCQSLNPADQAQIYEREGEFLDLTSEGMRGLEDLQAVPENVLLELFGDHARVVISNLGEVTTMEYDQG